MDAQALWQQVMERAEARDIRVVADDPAGPQVVTPQGRRGPLRLPLLARAAQRTDDAGVVDRFLDASLRAAGPWPPLEQVADALFFSAEPPPARHDDALLLDLGDRVCAAVVHLDAEELALRWVGRDALERMGADEDTVLHTAAENMARLLEESPLQVNALDGVPTGVFLTNSYLKPSLIMAPTLRSKVEPLLGWPVLALLPHRDFLMLVPEDAGKILPRLGRVVMDQFNGATDRLSTDVYRLSSDGIDVVGRFGR